MLPLIPWCLEIRLVSHSLVKRTLLSWVARDSQGFGDQDTSLKYLSHSQWNVVVTNERQFNTVFGGIVHQRMCV